MAQSHIIPVEVDEVRVTTVVDGVIDVLMAGTEVAERYMWGRSGCRLSVPVLIPWGVCTWWPSMGSQR